MTTSLSTPEACMKFCEEAHPGEIAKQLREDQRICREGGIPSLLAHFIPPVGTEEAYTIIEFLMPQTDVRVPGELQRLQYLGVIEGITSYLANMDHLGDNAAKPINKAAFDARLDHPDTTSTIGDQPQAFNGSDPVKLASNVLRSLRSKGIVADKHTLPAILQALDDLSLLNSRGQNIQPKGGSRIRPRCCYICRFVTYEPHKYYPALCVSCGEFNISEGKLSLPDNLDLRGKTALITGARVNLGYQTALRLLRCGATVIASTRYPQDAEVRYRAEEDSAEWIDRLSIVGADFRTAKDVFGLVGTARRILGDRQLFILINNAAQTLTDPIQAEQIAIANEVRLQRLSIQEDKTKVVPNGYVAHVRGGSLMPGGLIEASKDEDERDVVKPFKSYSSVKTESIADLQKDGMNGHSVSSESKFSLTQDAGGPLKSSWVQSINEIPYEDIITAHSVNTFVPLILIRELLPLMIHKEPPPEVSNVTTRPRGHIINVSSREGIFETGRKSSEKPARHVHTNMTKAGLNMITETEADETWRHHHIAMNSVDPGYMSAAPEMRKPGQDLPLKFEDGAARVLWTVAIAEGKTDRKLGPVYKRFLKHFGGQEVSVGLGR